MAVSTRTKVEQDMSRHTLNHIFTKLRGRFSDRTTFVVVEGSDDLAFYSRFFNKSTTAVYYATKQTDDGRIESGGCEELQNIVKTVLDDARTDKVVGIMDTDYRKYQKNYEYPQHIFHTDYRDMEMTALNTLSVKAALNAWISDFTNKLKFLEPMLRHAGKLRIMNDIYRLGCNFKKKCKINCMFNENTHSIYADWKMRYNAKFFDVCMHKKKQTFWGRVHTLLMLGISKFKLLRHSYDEEDAYDICHGHDTIKLLSLSLANSAIYSEVAIWEKCFDAYTIGDFKNTRLYASLCSWQAEKGVSLFR